MAHIASMRPRHKAAEYSVYYRVKGIDDGVLLQ